MTNYHIIDQVKADHRELEQYYAHYKMAQNPNDKNKWFNQFIWEISRHSVAEELILYPELERLGPKGQELAEHSREDHRKTKAILADIERHRNDDSSLEIAIDSMMSDLQQHIKKEEHEDLVFLDEHLTTEQKMKLGKQFQMKKFLAPTRPHPAIPDKPWIIEEALGLLAMPFDKIADLFRSYPETH